MNHHGAIAERVGVNWNLRMRFTAAVVREDDWYVARCLEVEVSSQGKTLDEALTNLSEALELYFDDQPFPEGIEAPIIAPVDIPA